MKKYLVLGSSGMLGRQLLKEAQKRDLYASGAACSEGTLPNIEDTEAFENFLQESSPDVIINTVALTDLIQCEVNPERAYAVNARPANVLARYCKQQRRTGKDVYLVQISTDQFWTDQKNWAHTESEGPVDLLNEYAASKFTAENFARTDPCSLVVRTNIAGPRNITWFLDALQCEMPITLWSQHWVSTIDIYSFAEALFDILKLWPTGVLNLASREVCTKREFFEELTEKLSPAFRNFNYHDGPVVQSVRRAESCGLCVDKAEQILGRKLPTRQEVVRRLVEEVYASF